MGRVCCGGIESAMAYQVTCSVQLCKYLEQKYEEFRARMIGSLSNAFTSAFKELDPIPQFKATAKLGEFVEAGLLQSFLILRRFRG
jgi:hypothetical protein